MLIYSSGWSEIGGELERLEEIDRWVHVYTWRCSCIHVYMWNFASSLPQVSVFIPLASSPTPKKTISPNTHFNYCPFSSFQFSSVDQSCTILRPHGLQHTRPPCPSPIPGVYSNSCPLSQWCHPIILNGRDHFHVSQILSACISLLQWADIYLTDEVKCSPCACLGT